MSSHERPHIVFIDTGVLAALGSAAAWALSSTLMATQTRHMDSASISAIRLVWAAVFFAVVLVVAGQVVDFLNVGWWPAAQLVAGALIGLGAGDTLYVRALAIVGLGRAFTVTLGLYTVFTFVLAAVLLGEGVTVPVVSGSVLVVVSVYVVSFLGRARTPAAVDVAAGRGELVRGLVLVAVVGLCWATATVWTRAVGEDISAVVVGAVRLPAAALLVGCVAGFSGASTIRQRRVPRRGFGVLTIAGLVGTGLGSLLFLYALQEAGAGKAAVLSSASPLFALPLGAVMLHERITGWVALGTLLAVAGIVLMSV